MKKKLGLFALLQGFLLCACTSRMPQPLDGDGMINVNAVEHVSYSVLGGMENEHYVLDLNATDSILTVEERNGEFHDYITKRYKIPSSYIGEIVSLAVDLKMNTWTNLKKAEEYEMDGPDTYFVIEYYTGTVISVSNHDKLPKGGFSGIRSVADILKRAIDDEDTIELSTDTDK